MNDQVKNVMIRILAFLCLNILCWQHLSAQDSLRRITDRHAADYMSAVSNHAVLFSGSRQQPLTQYLLNHQYLIDENYVSGRLSYNGVVYPDVLLRWDLYRDELLILSPAFYSIVLNYENIDFAELHGYRVFYLYPNGFPGCPPAGNYILLHSGKYLLVKKYALELLRRDNRGRRYEYQFLMKSKFYLQKDGAYYIIKNRRTLLKRLDTHRNELKQFIRANHLRYRKDAEKMVLEVVKEHEKLVGYE